MSYLGQNEPTPSEIRASHRKAVGGKRDRCSKGKNCSAACIERSDRCLVDFPAPASRSTTRLRDKVSQLELFPTERYIDKDAAIRVKEFKKRIERKLIRAIHLDDEDEYNRHRQKIIYFNKKVGDNSPSALKVPATWERVQNVKEAYEKAKNKILARLSKAAGRGDRKRYVREEERLLKIRRDLGVKVGDTAKYLRKEIWYRMGGGLIEARNKKLEREKNISNWQNINNLFINQAFRAVRDGNLTAYAYEVDRIAKLKEKVAQTGETFRVVNPPSVATAKKMIERYDKKFEALLRQVERDAAAGRIGAANKGVEELYKLHVNMGNKLGSGSFPLDRVEYARRGKEIGPLPTTSRMYPLSNANQFMTTERWTGTISRDFHDRFASILDKDSYRGREERNKIMERLKIGEATFSRAVSLIKQYTGTYYELIIDARKAMADGKPLTKTMKDALAAGRLIERFISAFPKEEIPKFRGGRMSDESLQLLIESSKVKGQFYRQGLITSWSSDLGSARGFADNPPGPTSGKPNRVILQTINRHGIPIESITAADGEMELLTSGRARYTHTGRYDKITHEGNTYHVFEVIER